MPVKKINRATHRMWLVLLFLAFPSLLFAKSNPLRGFGECALTTFPKPEDADRPGCNQASCVSIDPKIKICKCASKEPQEGDKNGVFEILKDGISQKGWPAYAYLSSSEDFEVLKGDLEGSGKTQWVVANRNSSSNGMAVSYWSVAILEDLQSFQPKVTFDLDDYGPGTFVAKKGQKGCDILVTHWKHGKTSGEYFVGQLYQYSQGKLGPVLNFPMLGRRYRQSFENERWKGPGGRGDYQKTPLKWLASPQTEIITNQVVADK